MTDSMHKRSVDPNRYVFVALLLVLFGAAVSRSAAQDYVREIQEVRNLYLASAEDASLIDSAFSVLDGMSAEMRKSVMARAYSGALVVMRAKHAFWPGRKLKHVRRGLRVLDELVLEYPRHAEVRYLRLISCYYLPGLFKRGASVADDFRVLSEVVVDLSNVLEPDLYADLIVFLIEKGELERTVVDQLYLELRSNKASVDAAGG